jgi:hypothetical protein
MLPWLAMISEEEYHIMEAQRLITEAALHVAKQRAILARRAEDGGNTAEAEMRLATLSEILAQAREELRKLREAQIK